MSLIDLIRLDKTLPCLAEPGKIIVIGNPDKTLSDVIPYLATLPGVVAYNPETLTLTFRRQAGFMTLYPDKVYITKVNDSQEGVELLNALLPQSNCKQCGEAGCLAFAVLLIQHKHTLDECLPLQRDPTYADRRATLDALLA